MTGGAGFIGSHLVDRLVRSGHRVVIIDDFSNGHPNNIAEHLTNSRVRLIRGNFADAKTLAEVLPGTAAIVHLAALVSIAQSVTNPEESIRVNTEGTIRLLGEAATCNVKKFIFASSAAVYGDSPPPLRETFPVKPLSPYAASKAAGEAYCRAYLNSYGLETVVLRLMNVYGPRSRGGSYSGVMTKFSEALYTGNPLMVYGDGRQTRDFVHVSDVVSAIVTAMTNAAAVGEIFNIGSGVPTSINSLADLFVSLSSRKVTIKHGPARKAEIRFSCADISKAGRMLGYHPRVALHEGVSEYLDWYKEKYSMGATKE